MLFVQRLITTFFSCFFRNWIQWSACYQLYNSQRLIFSQCTYHNLSAVLVRICSISKVLHYHCSWSKLTVDSVVFGEFFFFGGGRVSDWGCWSSRWRLRSWTHNILLCILKILLSWCSFYNLSLNSMKLIKGTVVNQTRCKNGPTISPEFQRKFLILSENFRVSIEFSKASSILPHYSFKGETLEWFSFCSLFSNVMCIFSFYLASVNHVESVKQWDRTAHDVWEQTSRRHLQGFPKNYIFTICSLYVHYMFTICSLYVHYIVHYMLTTCSLYLHNMFTVCSLYVHCMFTVCLLYVHCMFTIQGVPTSVLCVNWNNSRNT